jgi:hypothetical protein
MVVLAVVLLSVDSCSREPESNEMLGCIRLNLKDSSIPGVLSLFVRPERESRLNLRHRIFE